MEGRDVVEKKGNKFSGEEKKEETKEREGEEET